MIPATTSSVAATHPGAASAEAGDAGIKECTLARAKKVIGVMSYRKGESGERGKGQWLRKLPVVNLVDGDIKDATMPIKDAKGCQNNNGSILNPTEGNEGARPRIDKPNSLTMPTNTKEPVKGANLIKDARVPRVDEVGILNHDELEAARNANGGSLKDCIHGLPGGKNCYLCDPDHPYFQREGTR